jgi:hypothetical protein
MATVRPATDRPREQPRSHFWPRLIGTVSVGAMVLAPVGAGALWLLMSDPVTAAAVMERGSLLPVFAALAKMIGKALMSAMLAM